MKDRFLLHLSPTMKMWVHLKKKALEIIHNVDGKMFSHTISGPQFKNLKEMMSVSGLPPELIKIQLDVKKIVLNRNQWVPNKQMLDQDPERSQYLFDMEQKLIKIHNFLAEFNTIKQRENLQIIDLKDDLA